MSIISQNHPKIKQMFKTNVQNECSKQHKKVIDKHMFVFYNANIHSMNICLVYIKRTIDIILLSIFKIAWCCY